MNKIKQTNATPATQAFASRRANKKFILGYAMMLAATAITVSGCGRALDPPPPSHVFTNPDVRFPITVANEMVSIEIPVAANKDGFAGLTRHEISVFLDGYRRSRKNELFLAAPPTGSRSPLMASTIDELWDIFEREGISTDNVRIHDPAGSFESRPWITLTYYKDVAHSQPCGIWEHNLADDRGNIPYDNYGCFQQNNLAAMIAYPSDLTQQRSMSDRSNKRRSTMWTDYVKGTLDAKNKKKSKGGSTTGKK